LAPYKMDEDILMKLHIIMYVSLVGSVSCTNILILYQMFWS